ncbi:MAG: hypothetical protein B193_1568 [Solidesulfovibrio magneticus str. Maddingley MBC34]|uniref:SPOR domain-containing protein n=1 Tax=Solidesulfovibrio magneticus str. Maddingley MBC34 TaxID=1206767 RepID=K6HB24_9BACT|nr:MAG: hypothetical protein B193_1568 [Solidesulfovibrio magneticus str. Maddingley MBC34]
MTAAATPPHAGLFRRLTCLLAALCLSLPAAAATAGTDAPPAVTALVCGALIREPAPGEAWPAAKEVRPGEAVDAADRGLGCRFVVSGEAGQAPVAVSVRLTRPLPEGGTAEDVWQAAARPGEPAVAAYALVAGLPVAAGEWTLTLIPPGGQPAVARFQVAGRPAEAALPTAMQTTQGAKAVKTASAAPRSEPALPVAVFQGAPAAPEPAPVAPTVSAASSAPAEPNAQPAPPAAQAAAQPSRPPAAAASAAKSEPPAAGKASAPGPDKSAPASKAEPSAGYLALQTGLFADPDNAAAQAAKLRGKGLPACLAVSDKDGKRRYRVLAGRFGDRRAAAAARAEVMAATGVAPIVTPVAAGDIPRLRCR